MNLANITKAADPQAAITLLNETLRSARSLSEDTQVQALEADVTANLATAYRRNGDEEKAIELLCLRFWILRS